MGKCLLFRRENGFGWLNDYSVVGVFTLGLENECDN